MKRILLLAIALPLFNITFAQQIELLKEGSSLPKVKQPVEFHFLHHDVDTTTMIFVGRFRAYGVDTRSTIEDFYNSIRTEAKKNGANSFKLVRVSRAEATVVGELVLDTYFSSEAVVTESSALKERNAVYVFASEMKSNDKTTAYKVNNERKELAGGRYVRYDLPIGSEIKISKGGISGATAWFTGKEDKPAVYVSLTGMGVGPGVSPTGNGVGISLNSGRITPMDRGLGELLTIALEEVQ